MKVVLKPCSRSLLCISPGPQFETVTEFFFFFKNRRSEHEIGYQHAREKSRCGDKCARSTAKIKFSENHFGVRFHENRCRFHTTDTDRLSLLLPGGLCALLVARVVHSLMQLTLGMRLKISGMS